MSKHENNGREVKCSRCGHKWITRSDYFNVSCPSCQHKNRNPLYAGIEPTDNLKKELNIAREQ